MFNIKSIPYLLFLLGFSYYCILPIVFFAYASDYIIMQRSMARFYGADNGIEFFLYMAFIYFVLFSAGYYYTIKTKWFKFKVDKSPTKWQIFIITACYIVMAVLIVNIVEILHPVGYTEGYNVIHRGQLTTLYLTSIWWYIYFKAEFQAKIMLLVVLISGLNLIVLGSRLGLISGIIALYVNNIFFKKNKFSDQNKREINLKKIILFVIIVFITMSIMGLLRSQDIISLEGILSNAASESLYIYVSVPSYLSSTDLPYFSIPLDIFAGFIGSIPSYLFPEKVEFFSGMTCFKENSGSGFGGVHHIASLIANFGLIGFPFVVFLEGMWFGFVVKNAQTSPFFRAVALLSMSVIPFILFRDGYQTSVKLLFANFILIPYFAIQAIWFMKLLMRWASMRDINIQ